MIIIDQIVKVIQGKTILDGVSIQFEKGKIYGIVGDNGTGKSVLLKCMCGLLPYESGQIMINDKIVDAGRNGIPNIGVIIEHPGFLNTLSGAYNLKYLARIRGIVKESDIQWAISRVGLENEIHKKVKYYSLGMKQKLAIAQAIMERPEIYILDEPFNGLDYSSVLRIYDVFRELKKEGATLILVSHYESDIKSLCDEIYTLKDGKLLSSK